MSEVEDSDWLINRQHHLEKWFIDSHHISVCISSEFNKDNEHHQVDSGGLDADSSSSSESVDEVKQSESICSFIFFFRLHLVLVIWVSQCGILYLLLLDSIQEEENSELHHWTTRTCRDDGGETEREAVLTKPPLYHSYNNEADLIWCRFMNEVLRASFCRLSSSVGLLSWVWGRLRLHCSTDRRHRAAGRHAVKSSQVRDSCIQ